MKKSIIALGLATSILCTSCLGSFSAFNNLKEWNDGVTSNKFLDNLIFWGLNIIPVYGLFFVGDVLLFNVIEFWSGTNPIAMRDGEFETQIIQKDGVAYEMTATKNRMMVKVIDGVNEGAKFDLVFKPSEKSWNLIKQDGEIIKLASMEEGMVVYYLPDNSQIKLDANTTREEGLARIKGAIFNYNDCQLALAN